MDHERSDGTEKIEEIMLPGFRFHPTDEELVGFYLKRKIQQRPLVIELIKQLDIYKYDPWDLPKLATTGEKEWYFYCPRDRKYRNSVRPNRVTGAGFWKATGTDRPVYSSESSKCIGLKKSLVFYKGRAAKGAKTDWMMHEFRLPSLTDLATTKRFMDKTIPANDSWAICRIFKKTNSSAQRALSHSFVSPIPETSSTSDMANSSKGSDSTQLSSENMSSLTTKSSSSSIQINHNTDMQQTSWTTFSPLDYPYFKPISQMAGKPPQLPTGDLTGFLFAALETSAPAKCTVDVTSMLLNMSSMLGDYSHSKVSDKTIDFVGHHEHGNGFSVSFPHEMHGNISNGTHGVDQWEDVQSIGFPLSFPAVMNMEDAWKQSNAWKPSNVLWDSSSSPSEMSSSFSTAKCYT